MRASPEHMNRPERPVVSKDEQWAATERNPVIVKLKNDEAIGVTLEALPGYERAFARELDTLACADDRVPAEDGGKIGVAGQLILLSEEEIDRFVERNRGRIKVVVAHYDCGAAAKKFKELEKNGIVEIDGTVFFTPDQLGEYHSRRLAERLGAEYRPVKKPGLNNDIHSARMICFDGTGSFSPADIPDLPPHFVCSAPGFGIGAESQVTELNTLTGIALDEHHGFGQRFTSDAPFYIIVSAVDAEQLEELTETAQKAVAEFGARVKVKGFVRPMAQDNDLR